MCHRHNRILLINLLDHDQSRSWAKRLLYYLVLTTKSLVHFNMEHWTKYMGLQKGN